MRLLWLAKEPMGFRGRPDHPRGEEMRKAIVILVVWVLLHAVPVGIILADPAEMPACLEGIKVCPGEEVALDEGHHH